MLLYEKTALHLSTLRLKRVFLNAGPETGTDSLLRSHLKVRKLVDERTASTFTALAERRYILLDYRPIAHGVDFTYVQITPAGRKLVRASLDHPREKPLPVGTLKEWHWKALALAWSLRPEGCKADVSGYYGRISWKTWLRLRDYKQRGDELALETSS